LSSISAGGSEVILALSYQFALPLFSTAISKRMGSPLPFEGRAEAARIPDLYTFGVPVSHDRMFNLVCGALFVGRRANDRWFASSAASGAERRHQPGVPRMMANVDGECAMAG
jgi:hypothetical protein